MNTDKFASFIKSVPGLYTIAGIVRMFYSIVKHRSFKTLLFSPPGHFYSPLSSLKEVREKSEFLFNKNKNLLAINLREKDQLKLLTAFREYYDDIPFSDKPGGGTRYFYSNSYFEYGDAIILYSFMRHFAPKHIIEVGSGFSSAAMLDTNERFLDHTIEFTFIEPYSQRLSGLLTEKDRKQCKIIELPVQDVQHEVFLDLEDGDILFIDSSHVVKVGSDVEYILFYILPILKPGVIIHFHDIFWPFEYPESWILQGRSWNEAYFLRAFLQYNDIFEVLYFNSYIGSVFPSEVRKNLPLCIEGIGGSIWLRKKT